MEACLLLYDAGVPTDQRVLQPGEGIYSKFISQVRRRPTTERFSLHRRLILELLWPHASGGALDAVYGRSVHHIIVGSLGQRSSLPVHVLVVLAWLGERAEFVGGQEAQDL